MLFLRRQLALLGYAHVGQCVYVRLKPFSVLVCFYDDIFCWSDTPEADLTELGKTVAVDEIVPFQEGSNIRYVGLALSWTAQGIQFSIQDYCKELKSDITEKPLAFNRFNVEALVKTEGDVDRAMMKD